MSIEHDLHCTSCDKVTHHVAVEYGSYPPCASCGGEMAVNWEHRQPPSTDVFGCEQYSDATGKFHTSQRDKIKHMREHGYYEAGDSIGGARNVHRIEGTGFSFPGQTSRRTVGEGA